MARRVGVRLKSVVARHRVSRRTAYWMRYRVGRLHDPEFSVLSELRLRDAPILDIGGHEGQSILTLRLLYPGRRIISFEPNPHVLSDTQWSARLARNAEVRPVAVGSEVGEAVLSVPRIGNVLRSQGATLDQSFVDRRVDDFVQQYGRPPDGFEEQVVEVVTVDSLGLDPALVKVDAEGAEVAVLQGAADTIARVRAPVFMEVRRSDGSAQRLLESWGYVARGRDEGVTNRLFTYRGSKGSS